MSKPTFTIETAKAKIPIRRRTKWKIRWHRFRIGRKGRWIEDEFTRMSVRDMLFGTTDKPDKP